MGCHEDDLIPIHWYVQHVWPANNPVRWKSERQSDFLTIIGTRFFLFMTLPPYRPIPNPARARTAAPDSTLQVVTSIGFTLDGISDYVGVTFTPELNDTDFRYQHCIFSEEFDEHGTHTVDILSLTGPGTWNYLNLDYIVYT